MYISAFTLVALAPLRRECNTPYKILCICILWNDSPPIPHGLHAALTYGNPESQERDNIRYESHPHSGFMVGCAMQGANKMTSHVLIQDLDLKKRRVGIPSGKSMKMPSW